MEGQTLTQAQRQWFSRPDDERFGTLEELHAHVSKEQSISHDLGLMAPSSLRVDATGGVVTVNDMLATHWSFGQLAGLAKAPQEYMRKLPPALMADCINHGLRTREAKDSEATVRVLAKHNGGPPVLRAMNGPDYARVWSQDLVEGLMRLAAKGWVVPPSWGNAKGGLYASDRDLWVYMIDDARASIVVDPQAGREERLYRGFFMWNSEVGKTSWGMLCFLFNGTCGNHLVWGARQIKEFRFRHVGKVRDRIASAQTQFLQLAARSIDDDLDGVREAMRTRLAKDDAELVKVVTKRTELPKKVVTLAMELSRTEGNEPLYTWGMVQGLTAASRQEVHMDKRAAIDLAAARLMPAPRNPEAITIEA